MSYSYQKKKKNDTNYTSLDNPTPNTYEVLSTFCFSFLDRVYRGSVEGKKECNYPCQCLNHSLRKQIQLLR